jgi:hypothetical protein
MAITTFTNICSRAGGLCPTSNTKSIPPSLFWGSDEDDEITSPDDEEDDEIAGTLSYLLAV